jgi:hypothetical protein
MLQPTLDSLERSDLAGVGYEVLEAPMGLGTTEFAQWYDATMRRLISEPMDDGLPPDLVLRLEDDVVVNRYIAHNCCTWPAIREDDFGIGWLFQHDRTWDPKGRHIIRRNDGSVVNSQPDVSASQGQLFKSSVVCRILDQFENARRHKRIGSETYLPYPREDLLLDLVPSHASQLAGLWVYVHIPSLVNCHAGSSVSAEGVKNEGHYSNKTFSSGWRRL